MRSSLSEAESASTVELKVNYTRPGIGEYLVAKSTLSHRGKTLAVGEVKLKTAAASLLRLAVQHI
ncbi:hotdog domain-containing protein [Priestia megaterium]